MTEILTAEQVAAIAANGINPGEDDWRYGYAAPAPSGLLPEWEIAARDRYGLDIRRGMATVTMDKADNNALYDIIADLRHCIAFLVRDRAARPCAVER